MLLAAFKMMQELGDEWLSSQAEEEIEKLSSDDKKSENPPQEEDMSLT